MSLVFYFLEDLLIKQSVWTTARVRCMNHYCITSKESSCLLIFFNGILPPVLQGTIFMLNLVYTWEDKMDNSMKVNYVAI